MPTPIILIYNALYTALAVAGTTGHQSGQCHLWIELEPWSKVFKYHVIKFETEMQHKPQTFNITHAWIRLFIQWLKAVCSFTIGNTFYSQTSPDRKNWKVKPTTYIFTPLTAWMKTICDGFKPKTLFKSQVTTQPNHSIKAPVCQWVSLCVCSLTPPKWQTPVSWNFEGWFPLG